MATTTSKRAVEVLIADGDPGHDWCQIFANEKVSGGRSLHITQASWMEMSCCVYPDAGCIVTCAPVRESNNEVVRPHTLTVKPDLVIIRNQARGPTPMSDRRNVLLGLLQANVPCMNSALSEYLQLERPVMNGALVGIQKTLGNDKFPFIPMSFYSTGQEMIIAPEFPAIVKIGHAHRGMGKQKCNDSEAFRDLSTIVSLHEDYATAERFIDAEYGIRVQKIGDHYRCIKKVFTGSGWKSQFGGSDLQEIPLEPKYKVWVDECAKRFEGMEWCAVDGLHGKDGKDYIIELNGAAIGFLPKRWLEDTLYIKELVLARLNKLL